MELWRERIKIIKLIWPYMHEYRLSLAILFILKCGQGVPVLITPLLFKLFIDRVVGDKNLRFMMVVAVLFILVYLFETMLKVGHRYLDNHMFNDIAAKLRNIIWKNCLYMPYDKFKEYETSDLNNRINNDIDMVKVFMIWEVFDYLTCAVSLAAAAVILFFVDWRIAILFELLLPVSVLLSRRFQTRLGELYEKERELSSGIDQWIRNSLMSWKEVKANHLESYEGQMYEKLLHRQYDNKKKILSCLLNRDCVLDTKNLYIDQFLLLIIGGVMHFFYRSTIGSVLACIQYYNGMIHNLTQIIEINTNLEWVKPSIYRAAEMLSVVPDRGSEAGREDGFVDNIYEISHLDYRYPKGRNQIFTDFNMTISHGEKVLVKGTSGMGKSTLVRLLTKKLTTGQGTIYFYGKNIEDVDQRYIYQHVRSICQDPYYMNITMEDYLRLAHETATHKELEAACKKACILDYILSLPEGFDTMMGEKGEKLSGGQMQRLALARLFLVQDKTILLDEAFSAIDGKYKTLILKALLDQFKDNTVVCITHDQELEPYFDRVVAIAGASIQ